MWGKIALKASKIEESIAEKIFEIKAGIKNYKDGRKEK